MKLLDTGDKIYKYNKSIIIKFTGKRAVLSTGVINGGYTEHLTSIFNNDAKTAPGMGCQLKAPTYKEHMEIISKEMGLDPKYTTGMGTAADMENMCMVQEKYENLSVTALVTAGIETNGGRVGDEASYTEVNGKTEKINQGTINIIVSVNANLPPRTLTRALVTITEAKTAAIQELLEGSKYSHGLATGSGTDGTIVYADLDSNIIYNDAGKHSKLGELIGKSVKKAVKNALAKQSDLTPERQKSVFRRFRRYGVTAEKVWDIYIEKNSKLMDKKLEYIEFIEKIEKDEKLVTLTSLYIHLMDQYDWKLLSKKIVKEECVNILNQIVRYLEFDLTDVKIGVEEKNYENFLKYLSDIFINILAVFIKEKWEGECLR